MGLAGLLRAAETNEGLAAGFGGVEAGANAHFGVEGYVAFEFGGEVSVRTARAEQAAEAEEEGSEFTHKVSPIRCAVPA
jgi:hypothetical protein